MKLRFDEINKSDFINLLNELDNGSNTYKSSELHDCYFRMMVDKLRMDTDLNFYYRSGEIVSESLGVKISDISSYDELLEKVEKILVQNTEENQNEYDVNVNDLKSNWGYDFSHIEMTPYFETEEKYFKVWDQYAQTDLFEALYFGVFGEYHKDRSFAINIAKKYLEGDDWHKPKTYRGKIEELNGLEVAFMKNGKITIKTKNENFWNRIIFWYDICDSNFKNHRKY